jgi:hypothetical protein
MKISNKLTAVLILSLTFTNLTYAKSNFSYQQESKTYNPSVYNTVQQAQYPQNNVLQGNVVMVPAGTTMKANVTTSLSSAYLQTGQGVTLSLNEDFYYNNKLIAPAGSMVSGTVVEASKAKRGSMNGKLCIRFNTVTTPYGTQFPISAVISTDDSSGVLVGGTKMDVAKEYAKDVAAGSAVGALSGLVFGSLASGDKLGRGVALGTAVGAGGGMAKSLWDKGSDVEIPAGASINLTLTQPMSVSVPSYQFEN